MKQYATNVSITLCALTVFGVLAVPETGVLAYNLTGKSWSVPTATYHVNPNFVDSAAGTASDQTLALRSGADEWKMSGQGNFAFAYGGDTAITAVALDGTNAVYYAGGDGGGALAVCWYWFMGSNMSAFDIEFYDRDGGTDFVWSVDPSPSEFDIQGVACHEFGHALGMDHSGVAGATMYPSVAPGNTAIRSLDSDDIAGYQSLYGSGSPSSPDVTSVTPDFGWIDGGYNVTIEGSWFPSSGVAVSFDGIAATNVDRVASSRITCDVPAGVTPNLVDVSVTAGAHVATLTGGFNHLSIRNNSTPTAGSLQTLEVRVPAAPNVFFQGAVSMGNGGIPCGSFGDPLDTRVIPLSLDWILDYTVGDPSNGLTSNIQGFTDGSGTRIWQVFIPSAPQLSGMTFYASYVTGDMGGSQSGISYIGNAVAIVFP